MLSVKVLNFVELTILILAPQIPNNALGKKRKNIQLCTNIHLTQSISPSSASRTAQAQTSGLRHINQLIWNLSSESVLQGPNNNSPAPAPVLTLEEQPRL